MTISKIAIAATGLFAALSFSAVTAVSQDRVPCGNRDAILSHLEDGYSEQVTAVGLDAQGRMLEVVSARSGTWTILVTTPGQLTCLIASGVAWEEMKVPLPEDPAS